ncbi:putative cytochrome p450 [Trichoderma reesei RUT C-30]|uniref:Putative cytochrome p450 n=1 Tax=Hypocrea jecorina (strain ATCC 56765 / BCRC 32924 / NRRL 11460 / Rut C-30) TaxID=1344414 RepID=A0A024S967_HYPJR|nr:putative cytochrome p450 [Trichoderma reesei RUT C-30]
MSDAPQERIYVITKPKDVADAYRNTESLSFNEFVQAVMRACDNTESCIQAMYTPLPRDKAGFANPQGKSLATLARQMHIHQLYPGKGLDFLERTFLEWFDVRMNMEKLHSGCSYATKRDDGDVVLPLMEWCSDFLISAGQRAYFGDELGQIDGNLVREFVKFDELSWQVLYQYPELLAGEMKRSRDVIQRALKKYIQLPQSQRSGEAWFTKAMENEMRALNIGEDDIATMLMTIYWVLNTSTRKAAFWLLSYILHTPSLILVIRNETKPAFNNSDGKLNLDYIHNQCPQLNAMWNEMIRMSASAALVRFITADTVIGGKVLRRGNRLLIPFRQLHFDKSVFGETADSFDHERFLEMKPSLTQSGTWRPFGGGGTMCPGRHAAKKCVLLFVVLLLQRFDIEVDGWQSLPVADEGKPVLGIMSTRENRDLRVRVTARKTFA